MPKRVYFFGNTIVAGYNAQIFINVNIDANGALIGTMGVNGGPVGSVGGGVDSIMVFSTDHIVVHNQFGFIEVQRDGNQMKVAYELTRIPNAPQLQKANGTLIVG